MGHLKSLALLGIAVLVLSSPIFAQTVNLQLMNENPGNQIGGDYTYPYNFSINGSSSYIPLLCDSYDRNTYNGENWTANVYPLNSPLTSFGQSSQIPGYTPTQVYEAAAIIYSEILSNTVPGANGNPALASAYGNLAIWALFDGGSQNAGYDPAIEIPIMTNALNSIGQYGSGFYSQFSVYTPTDESQSGPQEFIGYTPAGPGSASVAFLGGGTSSLFQELGQAAVNLSRGPQGSDVACVWTQGAVSNIVARDNRTTPPTDEQGNIFVVWNPGTGSCAAPAGNFNVYSYMSLDSMVADRCFFEVDSSGTPGCVQVMTIPPNTLGANLLSSGDTAGGIPPSVISTLSGRHFFVAGTDIRPEDAKFAMMRAFAPCNAYMSRQYFNDGLFDQFGLGYGTAGTNVGTAIQGVSAYGGGQSNVVNFNITGNDPISNQPVAQFEVTPIGAQPIMIAVSPTTDGYVSQLRDVTANTLSQILQGNLARTNDMVYQNSFPQTEGEPLNVFLREPLSGTYNVMEYSIPNGTQFHGSQEAGNCSSSGGPSTNPLYLPTFPGTFGSGAPYRARVIGGDKMTTFLQQACPGGPWLGYFFWNAGSVNGLTNVKYLTVNGIDPLFDQNASGYSYTGILPSSGAIGDPGLANVTFAGLNSGNYPIWSALRLISPPGDAGVAAMITALHGFDSAQHDYIPASQMTIWHSHFQILGVGTIGAANGATLGAQTICAPPNTTAVGETGGDAGGSNMLIQNNVNFCQDFNSGTGKLNLTQ